MSERRLSKITITRTGSNPDSILEEDSRFDSGVTRRRDQPSDFGQVISVKNPKNQRKWNFSRTNIFKKLIEKLRMVDGVESKADTPE